MCEDGKEGEHQDIAEPVWRQGALRPRALAGAANEHEHEHVDDHEHAPELWKTSQRVFLIGCVLDAYTSPLRHEYMSCT
jgi:hypothetical protein